MEQGIILPFWHFGQHIGSLPEIMRRTSYALSPSNTEKIAAVFDQVNAGLQF